LIRTLPIDCICHLIILWKIEIKVANLLSNYYFLLELLSKIMRTILVLFIISCTHSFGLNAECPDKFIDLEGRCYYFSKDTANRIEASRNCTAMHSFLLSIQTEREGVIVFNQAVKENVKKEPFGYWTSGTRVTSKRGFEFVWSSTWEPLTYTAWCPSEPNNWMNDEYCIHLTNLQSHNTKACWNDRGCMESTTHSRHPMHYICETEAYMAPIECDE
uniref:C-type lectin domain-containing protein n=1 Tax=Strigamia maritima TaxID=126957 RepID=T1IXI1_STRMM